MKGIEKHITIIGGGTMGKALSTGFLAKKIVPPSQITVSDHVVGNLTFFSARGISTTGSNIESIKQADIVILAVKPQDVFSVLSEIGPFLLSDSLLISICAGITIEKIVSFIGITKPIIRAMPNTPAQIGKGITGWFANKYVSETMKLEAKKMFLAVGKEIEFLEERLLNIVTIVSGSGPAYFYYFIELFINEAVMLGLQQHDAHMLVTETFFGASELLFQSNKKPEELRRAVTSKGGTTEAAVIEFSRQHFGTILANGLKKALQRAEELAKK